METRNSKEIQNSHCETSHWFNLHERDPQLNSLARCSLARNWNVVRLLSCMPSPEILISLFATVQNAKLRIQGPYAFSRSCRRPTNNINGYQLPWRRFIQPLRKTAHLALLTHCYFCQKPISLRSCNKSKMTRPVILVRTSTIAQIWAPTFKR